MRPPQLRPIDGQVGGGLQCRSVALEGHFRNGDGVSRGRGELDGGRQWGRCANAFDFDADRDSRAVACASDVKRREMHADQRRAAQAL